MDEIWLRLTDICLGIALGWISLIALDALCDYIARLVVKKVKQERE